MAKEMDVAAMIATISKATLMVETVNDAREIWAIRNEMELIAEYLKQCKAAYIHQHNATKCKILSERRLGHILIKSITAGRPSEHCPNGRVLEEIGITHKDSSRCQRIAKIPEPELQSYFETLCSEGLEATTAGVMRLWKALNREEQDDAEKPFLPSQEQEAIFSWLMRRRESWPEQFRPTFTGFVRRILDHLEEPRENDGREGADCPDAEAGAA